jgi:tripartite-type tricarboxylate transporter receptor subunit TctC
METTTMKASRWAMLWLAAMLGPAQSPAHAQQADYPARPIRFVVPFAAGGPTDAAARLFAEPMRKQIGQSVVIENRPGGGGTAGTEAVLNGPRDGYMLLLGAPGPLFVTPSVRAVRYDVQKDLIPLAEIWRSPQVLIVHPKLKAKKLGELIVLAKAGKLNAGSAGVGTLPHLSIELLKREAGIDIVHIPYRGTGAAVPDLLGGSIDMMFGDVAVLAPLVTGGKAIALAVTAAQRSPLLPDVPTTAEAGMPALSAENWYAMMAPANLPAAVMGKLTDAARGAVMDTEFRAALAKQGAGTGDATPERLAQWVATETAKWAPIARAAGIKLD